MGAAAFGYVRISRDMAGEGLGVERQEADIRKLADRLDLSIVEVFRDNSISAYSGKRRPGYEEMLSRLGEVEAVLAWHEDRLHRQPIELEEYVSLVQRHNVKTHMVMGGEVDLASPEGLFRAGMMGQLARYESAHKAVRVKRAKQQAFEAGKWLGGPRPWGYNVDNGVVTVNEVEAEWIVKASQRILEGGSMRSIINELTEAGIPTAGGKPWSHAGLRSILMRPRNAGLAERDGVLMEQSLFPAIVSEDTWRGVKAVLTDPSRRTSFSNATRWMLSRIAKCECGTPVRTGVTGSRGRTRTSYRCPERGAGHVGKDALKVDEVVNALMPKILAIPEVWQAVTTDESSGNGSALAAEAAGYRARLEEASNAYVEGVMSLAQMSSVTAKLNEKLEALEEQMASSPKRGVVGADGRTPEQVWEQASLESRRVILNATVRVTILRTTKPTRNFDPTCVRVEPA